MSSFALDPELEAFRHEVRKLAEGEFADKAAYWDEAEEFPVENRNTLAELGYLGMAVPEEYGGSGTSIVQGVVFLEELARVCFNTALVGQLYLNGPSRAIALLGSDAQMRKYLPEVVSGKNLIAIAMSEPGAGSATTDLTTKATEQDGGYVLNGQKCFVTGGHLCTHALVFARFGESSGARGIGALIVDRNAAGFEAGKPDRKMGGRGVPEAPLFFDDCRVSKEDVLVVGDPDSTRSFVTVMSSFGPERVGNAAMCVGLAQGAFDTAKTYAEERRQFDRPLTEFQGIQWKFADMVTDIGAARMLVYRAATHLSEQGFPDPQDAAMAKLYANEMVQRVTNEALQIHGHYGYTRDYPLERMVRDGRGFALGGGTVEILRNTIAANIFRRSFDQRRG
jgi:butyryl-CoA dehydrogenase